MDTANMAQVYKTQQVLTASPEQLTLMLYNGAIRFIKESIQALNDNNFEQAHNKNIRAQDILKEFMCTLDMKYELSKNYYALYEYISFCLVQANIHKDPAQLEEAQGLLTELRDTWAQAMKLARGQAKVG